MISIRVYCAESEAKSAGSAVHRNVPRQFRAATVPYLNFSLSRAREERNSGREALVTRCNCRKS
jgi:hypothetical protein